MTPAHLVKAVAEEIRLATQKIKLPIEYMQTAAPDDFVKINVFEQYLPPDLFEQTTYFPCVTVELISLRDNLIEGSTAEIGLSFGTYSKEADAWRDCFHLMQVAREWLLRRRIVAQKFRLKNEIVWSFPEEQPMPFFFGYGNLQYEIFMPQEEGLPI